MGHDDGRDVTEADLIRVHLHAEAAEHGASTGLRGERHCWSSPVPLRPVTRPQPTSCVFPRPPHVRQVSKVIGLRVTGTRTIPRIRSRGKKGWLTANWRFVIRVVVCSRRAVEWMMVSTSLDASPALSDRDVAAANELDLRIGVHRRDKCVLADVHAAYEARDEVILLVIDRDDLRAFEGRGSPGIFETRTAMEPVSSPFRWVSPAREASTPEAISINFVGSIWDNPPSAPGRGRGARSRRRRAVLS